MCAYLERPELNSREFRRVGEKRVEEALIRLGYTIEPLWKHSKTIRSMGESPFDILANRNDRKYGIQVKITSTTSKYQSFHFNWRNMIRLKYYSKLMGYIPTLAFIRGSEFMMFVLEEDNVTSMEVRKYPTT